VSLGRVVTFGEIMLRLAAPDYQRLLQSPGLEASFGGSEANVAVALAGFGAEAAFVTLLPENDIADACVAALRAFAVDTSLIRRASGRMGVYFLEQGAGGRPSRVIYDRAGSSLAVARAGALDWGRAFAGADWFHVSGITPAISAGAAELCLEGVAAAGRAGLTVSCDLNFRAKLWRWGKRADHVMPELMRGVDVCIGNRAHCRRMLGVGTGEGGATRGECDEALESLSDALARAYPRLRVIALTARGGDTGAAQRWSGGIRDREAFQNGSIYLIEDVVDPIGAGDAFAAGLIHGLRCWKDSARALELALAAGYLKHFIRGDCLRARLAEVEALARGESAGRIRR